MKKMFLILIAIATPVAALSELGGLDVVTGVQQLLEALTRVLTDPDEARRRGRAALAAIERNRGAMERTLEALKPFLAGSE